MTNFYTIDEYMKLFKIRSRTTVTKQIKQDLIKAQNVGTGANRPTWRIPADQFEKQSNHSTIASA